MSDVKAKVLIIDDEPGIRDLLNIDLTERGYEVRVAADGDAGLRVAESMNPDVVICDIRMPRRDGLSTLKEIKARGMDAEVIMLTGYGAMDSAIESMKLGAYDYLTKPCGSDNLAHLIKKALEKKRLHQKVTELETMNRLKTEFLAMMSHELRTPLNTVIGFTGLLLKETYGPLVSEQIEVLGRIESSGRQLLDLINNLLDLSKLAAERMPLLLTTFPLRPLIDEVSITLESQATSKGVGYVVEMDDNLQIHCDRMRLKQILINLMGNAIKFTTKGHVTLQVKQLDSEIQITIQDTGIGIHPEHLSKIFDEFYQLDPSFTREFGGTGLGLAIVKKMVGLLGGHVQVESVAGSGSLFTVVLPQSKNLESNELVPPTGEPAHGDRRCVVVVDDDPSAAQIIRDMLKGLYRIVVVTKPNAVMTTIKMERPMAMTLDLMMPGKSGWSLLKELKMDSTTKKIPVIVTSSAEDHELAAHFGAAAYLVKPIERDVLVETLAKLIQTTEET